MVNVSVIVPAYNQGAYLAEAIRSVRDQTFTEWELVIVNDGSTDDTSQVLSRFDDSRMRVVVQPHKGVSAARNAGIHNTSAPLVAFLDADDAFMPDAIAALRAHLMAAPDVGVAVGARRVHASGGKAGATSNRPLRLGFPELLLENDIPLDGAMIRREWLQRVGGFDESLDTNEDWDLWLRLLIAGCRLARLEKIVVSYRIHAGQVTQDEAKMRIGTMSLWDKFFNLPNLPPDLHAYRDVALSAARVRTAARAFRARQFTVGNSDLVEATKLDAGLCRDRYKRLVDLLRGWADDPLTPDPEAYLVAVSKHVTPELPGLRRQLRKATAAMILEPLFGASPNMRRRGKWPIVKAIVYDPSWLTNRGVLRMMMEGWRPCLKKGAA